MTRPRSAMLAGLALVASALALPRAARAEPVAQIMLGLDGDLAVLDTRHRTPGGGGDVRVGFRFGWPRWAFIDRTLFGAVFFQPEAVFGYRKLPFDDEAGDARMGRASGGLRTGFILPCPFEIIAFNHWGAGLRSDARLLWDIGHGIDFRTTATSLGIHATYNHLSDAGAWLEAGLHFEYRLLP